MDLPQEFFQGSSLKKQPAGTLHGACGCLAHDSWVSGAYESKPFFCPGDSGVDKFTGDHGADAGRQKKNGVIEF